jgi:hypothetical protein
MITSSIKRYIEVSFQKEGIHKYPAALTDPALATGGWDDVSFLGNPHRHIFHFYVRIAVTHNDRDIEFIQFKRWMERLYTEGTMQVDFQSCEMLAEALMNKIEAKYPGRSMIVKVFEDNENGAVLEYIVP